MTGIGVRTLIAAGAALGITLVLVPALRQLARATGIVATPRVERWGTTSTPYLGGVAIVLASLSVFAATAHMSPSVGVLIAAASSVGLVGLADDIRPATIPVRLAVEGSAALAVALAGIRPHVFSPVVDVVAAVVLLVVLCNAFNYIDNIDAALSLVSVSIASAVGIAALIDGNAVVAGGAAAVLGACLGFLVFNWHPASIFMGDAGSLFLGFLLGSLLLQLHPGRTAPSRSLVIALVMFVPLFDMTVVYVARALEGRPLYVGGTDHTSHRIVRAGASVRLTALVLLVVSAVTGAFAVAVAHDVVGAVAGTIALAGVAVPVLVAVLRLDRVASVGREPHDEQGASLTR